MSSDTPKESCGFFAGLFGSSSSSSVKTEKCISCGNGMDDCACNNVLKEHLKKCCGYGTLPKLIEKCCETPGWKDPATITGSSCAGGCSSAPKDTCGGCGEKKDACTCGAPKDPCGEKKDTCGAPKDACGEPKDTCGAKKDTCGEKKEECGADKCGGGGGKVCCPPMPPTNCCNCKPAWMKCPPSITVKTYAAPENDRILPLMTGGRLGGGCGADTSPKCGSCGTDKPPPGKPKISAGCPMGKAACPGMASKDDSPSFFAKIIAFFKESDENAKSVCTRDVFNPSLVVREDGYMCPLLQAVDCAGNPNPCDCPQVPAECADEPVVEEEICEEEVVEEEICEEEVVEEEICEEELDEEICEEEPEEECEEEKPAEEFDCCKCCEELKKSQCEKPVEEEECVDDGKGECILEDTEECVEEECFEFDPVPNFKIKKATNCGRIEEVPGICPECGGNGNACCSPDQKFVQRVIDPFSDSKNANCDIILKDMCTPKGPKYEEPKELPVIEVNNNCIVEEPIIEKVAEVTNCTENLPVEIQVAAVAAPVVLEVIVETPPPPPVCTPPPPPPPPTCPTPPPAPEESCNARCGPSSCYPNCQEPSVVYQSSEWEYDAKPLSFCPSPASQQCPVPPPPPPPPPVVVVEEVCPPPVVEQCAPPPPPRACYQIQTPRDEPECPKAECEVKEVVQEACAPPPPEAPRKCGSSSPLVAPTCAELCQSSRPPCPDDPIAKLVCGCDACSKLRGCSPEEMFIPEWKPTPRGACPYCGASERGSTEDCLICQITRSMRDPCYKEPCDQPKKEEPPCDPKPPCPEVKENKCYSDKFDMKPDGTPTYEGGMCLERAMRYLSKTNPRKNSLEEIAIEGQTFEGFGSSSSDNSSDNSESDKKKYDGGMSLDDAKEYIWKAGK